MTAATEKLAPAPAEATRARSRRKSSGDEERQLPLGRQILVQLMCFGIALTVLFPVIWILSMSIDPRNLSRPVDLNLIPPGASFDAYAKVLDKPTNNPITFAELAFNSFKVASLTALVAVGVGVSAAYAFSRLKFRGRESLMIAVLGVLMLPAVATIIPLYVFLNQFRIEFGEFAWNLRASLLGVILAIISSQLPFAIWNLKGYLDTIPKDLEEAAAVDGASQNQTFVRVVLPLAAPALAVTAFLGFLGGWTEYLTTFMFVGGQVRDWTLAIALNGMVGQFARTTQWSEFAAFAILFALPVSLVFFFFQRYIVGGLAIGGVKG